MTQKQHRGFATWPLEKRLEVAAKGGRSCPPEKRTFNTDRALAVRAGAIGGRTRRRRPEGPALTEFGYVPGKDRGE